MRVLLVAALCLAVVSADPTFGLIRDIAERRMGGLLGLLNRVHDRIRNPLGLLGNRPGLGGLGGLGDGLGGLGGLGGGLGNGLLPLKDMLPGGGSDGAEKPAAGGEDGTNVGGDKDASKVPVEGDKGNGEEAPKNEDSKPADAAASA